jgi:acetyl esterase/lipase
MSFPAGDDSGSGTGSEHRIWPGVAPGSEGWTQEEEIIVFAGEERVRNVVIPTLTAFLPDGHRTRAAAVVAPGGGFQMLTSRSEGIELARWLAARGVAAFVLKYRLADTGRTREDFDEAFQTMWSALLSPPVDEGHHSLVPGIDGGAIERGVADGRQAVRLVRRCASDFQVDPRRVAMIGFSAGAILTVQAAVSRDHEERPDLAVAVYGGALEHPVPSDAPATMFIAAADDPLCFQVLAVHAAWRAAGRPAELHLYEQGGHGFGVATRGLPVDSWPDRMWAWLASHGFCDE